MPQTRRRIGDRAFSVAAPQAWNRLPTELKLLRLTDSFRHDLKTFLFLSVYVTRIRIDSVMRLPSSNRGRNTVIRLSSVLEVVPLLEEEEELQLQLN